MGRIMKPFNLEDAKAGKPICTRDSLPARIICFNKQGDDKPIVALIHANLESNKEHPACYTEKGEFSKDLPNCCHDLMMVE